MVCLLERPTTVYRPRQSAESDFHRLIRVHFADFRAAYPQRYAHQFGYWRPVLDKAVRQFLRCGDLRHGFARVRCPDCRHEFLVAFSCKERCICPSCSQKRTVLLGLRLAEDVCLDVPHRQFVWTIPKRLRIFFRFHRSLLDRLPALAWQSVVQVYKSLLGPEATPGGVLAIQTFGQLLNFHPHLHGLVTDGAFLPDGRFLPVPANLTHEPFLRLWEDNVFRLLLDENRIEPSLVAQMRSWRHSGFNVDRRVRLPAGDREGVERLGQYLARGPFSVARLVRITPDGKVLYRAERDPCQRYPEPASADLLGGVARNFQVFEPLDFLAELTQHIPNKGEHLVRYYGHYSNKARGLRAKQAASTAPAPSAPPPSGEAGRGDAPAPSPEPSERRRFRGWAVLIKRIYQADPLRCPRCGGTMKIIAFIEARQGAVIERILRHLGLWEEFAPRDHLGRPVAPAPRRTRTRLGQPMSQTQISLAHEARENLGNLGQMEMFPDP